jgi:hypothetical protein
MLRFWPAEAALDMDDNGPGGTLIIANGGRLTAIAGEWNVLGGAYDEVTYRIPAHAPETYLRLKIHYP